MRAKDVPIEHLHERFYEDANHCLRWRRQPGITKSEKFFNTRFADKLAGTLWKGYSLIVIYYEGVKVRTSAHRVLWAMRKNEWPADDLFIDHINGDRAGDHPENHRLVTIDVNAINRKQNKNSTSGYKGVSFAPDIQKWRARVQIQGKRHIVGNFLTALEAAKAYDEAAIKHHGEFARTNASLGLL